MRLRSWVEIGAVLSILLLIGVLGHDGQAEEKVLDEEIAPTRLPWWRRALRYGGPATPANENKYNQQIKATLERLEYVIKIGAWIAASISVSRYGFTHHDNRLQWTGSAIWLGSLLFFLMWLIAQWHYPETLRVWKFRWRRLRNILLSLGLFVIFAWGTAWLLGDYPVGLFD